jgi:endonuclease YncB( thermonuclease family)
MKLPLLILALFILSTVPLGAADYPPTQQIITGHATYVVDGDTLDVDKTRVRLWGINTPERKEAGYQDAKDYLKNITANATLNCMAFYFDKWKRTVASCEIEGQDVARMMVLSGMARDYKKYSAGYYKLDEDIAKRYLRGMWKK